MDDPTVVVVSPGSAPSPEETGASAESALTPQNTEAAVAAAAQQAVETGTQLGVLQARVEALTSQVESLQTTCVAGFEQQARLLAELDLALQSVGETLETVEEQLPTEGATPVQVETPAALLTPAPVQRPSLLRRIVLGG